MCINFSSPSLPVEYDTWEDHTEQIVRFCSGCNSRTQEAFPMGGESKPLVDGWRLLMFIVTENEKSDGETTVRGAEVRAVRCDMQAWVRKTQFDLNGSLGNMEETDGYGWKHAHFTRYSL